MILGLRLSDSVKVFNIKNHSLRCSDFRLGRQEGRNLAPESGHQSAFGTSPCFTGKETVARGGKKPVRGLKHVIGGRNLGGNLGHSISSEKGWKADRQITRLGSRSYFASGKRERFASQWSKRGIWGVKIRWRRRDGEGSGS